MREPPEGGASPPSKSPMGELGLDGGPGAEVDEGANKLKMSPFWPRWWETSVWVGVIGVGGGGWVVGVGAGLRKSSMAALVEWSWRVSSHFLGEDPLLYPLTGNSPKARHGAGVIADQKMRRGKIGKNGNHTYPYSTSKCTGNKFLYIKMLLRTIDEKKTEKICIIDSIQTLQFLSDPGVPGVRSMGPDLTDSIQEVLQT